MRTRDRRRQRRPLGSVCVGQAPQKRSLAASASCLLPNMVAPWRKRLATWAASIHAKYGEKYGKKVPKNAQIQLQIIKTAPNLANEVGNSIFWPEPVILSGCNTG